MLLRLVAFALDGMFALVIVFVWRLLFSAAGTTPWESARAPLGVWVWVAVAVLLVLRIVVFASPAKWLLCCGPAARKPLNLTQRGGAAVVVQFWCWPRNTCSGASDGECASCPQLLLTALRTTSRPARAGQHRLGDLDLATEHFTPAARSGREPRQEDAPATASANRSWPTFVAARRGDYGCPARPSSGSRGPGRGHMRNDARRVDGAWAIEELERHQIHSRRTAPRWRNADLLPVAAVPSYLPYMLPRDTWSML
jgi:hypothetical protein